MKGRKPIKAASIATGHGAKADPVVMVCKTVGSA
jgi:hypothetical protein